MDGSKSTDKGKRPVLGLIALNRDTVIENDMHRLIKGRADLITTRIPLGKVGSLEHLKDLEDHLPSAARLLSSATPSAIGFGCTSGVAAIGTDNVHERIREQVGKIPTVDPLNSMAGYLKSLGAKRIAVVTPYASSIADLMAHWFTNEGFEVLATSRVDRIPKQHYADVKPDAIQAAVAEAALAGPDGFVIGCTDLRVIDLIADLESQFRRPVTTSNQALAFALKQALGG